ncbi:hypothetical protein B0A79_15350 [Flavobacterium piscis]|uniref:HNH endonuclease n=1 Tax=Flavobacterium piscis TaxID=1114874 RepID=A0ABX2XGT1_9FLAO|nr:hypothetical protein [Flavobacterium piscis]OCB73176.1 hypothetical protein FLP_10660 [Flavobacterium piscis]OXG02820.1 hypothetical protein B0A79_15350 [Flavobacterium piscis]
MRNLDNTTINSFDFHKLIVDSKKATKLDPDFKTRLVALENEVEELYNIYKINFDSNSLEKTVANSYPDNHKNDLLKLYNYKSKLIQALKIEITTTSTHRILNTCQNCTLSEINSFDHILPKEEFSEFVVNPLNLFPSCTICNSYKSRFWQENGKRLYLNLYLDELPKSQYLFVDIDYKNDTFGLRFYLENRSEIDENLFNIIQSHYNKLHLLERFSRNSDKVITPLQNKIRPFINIISIEEIIKMAIQSANLNRNIFGMNYWESILELALINNDDFLWTL